MQSRNGNLFQDVGNYTCTWPDHLKFCGQDVCGDWSGNSKRKEDPWFFWDYTRSARNLRTEVEDEKDGGDIDMTFSNPLMRKSPEDGN